MRLPYLLLRSVAAGWATLLLTAFLAGRILRKLPIPQEWTATISLTLDGGSLFLAGWVAGRLTRSGVMLAAGIFAATLALVDFNPLLALNAPWLARLVQNSFRNSRYLDSLLSAFGTQAFLFGCLFAGAWESRPNNERPLSITDGA
jgi:hypothetical protein